MLLTNLSLPCVYFRKGYGWFNFNLYLVVSFPCSEGGRALGGGNSVGKLTLFTNVSSPVVGWLRWLRSVACGCGLSLSGGQQLLQAIAMIEFIVIKIITTRLEEGHCRHSLAHAPLVPFACTYLHCCYGYTLKFSSRRFFPFPVHPTSLIIIL